MIVPEHVCFVSVQDVHSNITSRVLYPLGQTVPLPTVFFSSKLCFGVSFTPSSPLRNTSKYFFLSFQANVPLSLSLHSHL